MSTTNAVLTRKFGPQQQDTLYYKARPAQMTSHPWFTMVTPVAKGWQATITPGFVNGIAPIYVQKIEQVENAVQENSEKPYTKEMNLLEEPQIAIPPDPIYFSEPKSRPDFFETIGAGEATPNFRIVDGEAVFTRGQTAPTRSMLQTVIYLAKPRATQRLDTQYTNNILLGSIVEYKVSYDIQTILSLGTTPRIQAAAEMPPDTAPQEKTNSTTVRRVISTALNFEDSGFDYMEIATIYFVAPADFNALKEGTAEQTGRVPSKNWEIYVKHNLFWNLFYESKTMTPVNIPVGGLDPATAFFVGRFTSAPAATVAAQNEVTSRVLSGAFNDTSNRGRYWTA